MAAKRPLVSSLIQPSAGFPVPRNSTYSPGAAPFAQVAKSARGGEIIYRGRWANTTPGWTGRHMWTGRIRAYPPPYEVVPVRDAEGNVDLARTMVNVRRQKLPAHLNRVRKLPELVFVPLESDYVEHIQKDGWKDAAELTNEHREMILDFYGDDLTPAMLEICAEQIAAREANKRAKVVQEKAAARPVVADAEPRRDTKPRAGEAPKKRGRPKKVVVVDAPVEAPKDVTE